MLNCVGVRGQRVGVEEAAETSYVPPDRSSHGYTHHVDAYDNHRL